MSEDKKIGKEMTGLTRRQFVQGVAAVGTATMFAPLIASKLHAEDFPSHEFYHTIAFSPGGSSDRASRRLKPFLDKHFGQPVVMENKPGASGMAGWTYFMHKEKNGYNICFVNWPLVYQAIRFKNARFKISDFAHIGGLTDDPMLFLRHKDSKHQWNTFDDFVEDCKKHPNEFTMSMTGPASPHNIASHAVMDAFDIKFTIVNAPGGSGPAASMLAGQHVDGMVGPALSSFGIRDSAVCFGICADRTVPNMWPEGKPISQTTGVAVPSVSIPRGFATHAEVKEKYPDRFEWLVEHFKAAATDPEFIKQIHKDGLTDVMFWFPPEELDKKAKNLMALVDKYAFLFE
jgi:putative tricarboxylic transport membrane protein